MGKQIHIERGQIIGRRIVLSKHMPKDGQRATEVTTLCACGEESRLKASALLNGKGDYCLKCARRKQHGKEMETVVDLLSMQAEIMSKRRGKGKHTDAEFEQAIKEHAGDLRRVLVVLGYPENSGGAYTRASNIKKQMELKTLRVPLDTPISEMFAPETVIPAAMQALERIEPAASAEIVADVPVSAKERRYVYHYVAKLNDAGGTRILDGMVTINVRISDAPNFINMRNLIARENNIPDPTRVTDVKFKLVLTPVTTDDVRNTSP